MSTPMPEMPAAAAASAASPARPDAAQLQNIWLAGLGAMARAQADGSKVFDALVQKGLEWQSHAHEQIAEATQRAGALAAGANPAGGARWNALEGIFEQRVARALANLGLPSAQEMARLCERVEALENLAAPAPARRAAAKAPAPRAQPVRSGRK